ncbi:aspartyl protease family protein [Thalassotalea euphylliae]|uniref:aspartyl protease family protein n=1 Tax=Thalassotalea euphylliae TaxID=1655234 RepID=UPI00363C4B73
MGGCGVVNKVRLMNANNDLKPVWKESHSVAKPDADYVYAKPYIYASIDGVSKLKFLIDTGSSISMLFDTPNVKTLQLTQGYELKVGGFGGHEYSTAFQTEVNALIVDNIAFDNVNFGYIPLSKTQFFIRPDQAGFDGVIGNDILKGLVWHFDRDVNQVSVYKQLPESLADKDPVWVPFDTFFGKISFPVKITFSDHVLERDVILDTGSRYHMSINDAYFDGDKVLPSPVIRSAGYSLSGMALHVKANTPLVEVGSLTFSNVLTNIIDEEEDDFWTLGSALLSQYEIIVDYPNMQLGFVTREGHTFKSQHNLLGLELRKLQNGNFIVGYTSPDQPAQALNFSIGTEISSINGIKSQEITVDEWLDMASKVGEFEFCLHLRAECKKVTSNLLPGLSMQ